MDSRALRDREVRNFPPNGKTAVGHRHRKSADYPLFFEQIDNLDW